MGDLGDKGEISTICGLCKLSFVYLYIDRPFYLVSHSYQGFHCPFIPKCLKNSNKRNFGKERKNFGRNV